MTAAQTRGDTIHARNLYAAEVRLTGVDEYVLLRLNVSDGENLAPLGSGEFREPDRIPASSSSSGGGAASSAARS
jgi:hypothetical protein